MTEFSFENYPYTLIDEATFKDGEPKRIRPDTVVAGEILSLRAHYNSLPGQFYRIWMQIEDVATVHTGGFAVKAAMALCEDLPLNTVHFNADAFLQGVGEGSHRAQASGYISNADQAIGGGFDAALIALTNDSLLAV